MINSIEGKINKIREAYGKPMTVTSCWRSPERQIEIYRQKGITDLSKIPMNSQHIHSAACDIADSNGELKKWTKENEPLLEEIGLWCEDLESTPTWVHYQIFPPHSNARFFKP